MRIGRADGRLVIIDGDEVTDVAAVSGGEFGRISAVCPMSPGDLIFTGTPSGVGMGRQPQEFLQPGTTLVSTIEGLGELRNALVTRPIP
jgi:hypothetical protein